LASLRVSTYGLKSFSVSDFLVLDLASVPLGLGFLVLCAHFLLNLFSSVWPRSLGLALILKSISLLKKKKLKNNNIKK